MPKVKHTTRIEPLASGDLTVYQAVCTCGWTWSNRFYRNRAEHDAAVHLRRVLPPVPPSERVTVTDADRDLLQ
jgi:hypothetical protein